MALIRARMHFAVRELWTQREVLGSTHEFKRGPLVVRITFPSHKDDFDLRIVRDDWRDRAIDTVEVFGPDPIEKVLILQIVVEGQANFGIQDFPSSGQPSTPAGKPTDATSRAASDFLSGSLATAEVVIHDFLSWTKMTHEQRWLGLTGEIPESFGSGELFDLDAGGARIPFGTVNLTGRHRPEESALSLESMAPLVELLERQETLGLAEEFLVDAEHFIWRADTTDLRRAVLLAAIACEIKAKETLEQKAPPEAAPLVELLLAGPRSGVSVRASALFDSVPLAAVGRSLRDEDHLLYKCVEELFVLRNRVAHRGQAPDQEAAQDSIRAARQALDWLNAL